VNMNKMIEDLGAVSIQQIADGTWLCQVHDLTHGGTYSGNTPEQAVRNAHQAVIG